MPPLHDDNSAYFRFTGPARFDKAVHTLEGIVSGIAIDRKTNDRELAALTHWIGEHSEFIDRHPFNEIIPRLNEVVADFQLDEEEKADVLWLCQRVTTDSQYYCQATADMQRLHGLMAGIVADGVITEVELRALGDWLDERTHMRTCWPYDEVEAIILHVLKDGRIDAKEQRGLVEFFGQFAERPHHRAPEPQLPEDDTEAVLISGVCAVSPEIQISGRRFCFTGRSQRFSRFMFENEIQRHGGIFSKSVTLDLDYLTIGADGNPCWAYACYGRKVEQAVKYRRQGARLLIIHEYDLWDAMRDAGIAF